MISMGGWVGFGPMVKPIWNTQIHLKHPNAMTLASMPVESLLVGNQTVVSALCVEDSALELDPPCIFDDDAPVLAGGHVLDIIHAEPDKIWVENLHGITEKTPVTQSKLVGTLPDLFEAFHEQWRKRWCKHDQIPHSQWNQILDFAKRAFPVLQLPHLQVDSTLLKAEILRKKARSATGLDGVSRVDLVQATPNVLLSLLSCYHRAETDGLWPQQLLAGSVVSLAKTPQASKVNAFRPITIFGLPYRLWSGLHARHALNAADEWVDAGVYGNRRGHQAADMWSTIIHQVADSYANESHFSGLIADIEKAYNCLPRWPVFCAAVQAGTPNEITTAWAGATAQMVRHFKIRDSYSPGFLTSTGLAEGDALSCYGMLLVDHLFHRWIAASAPSIQSLSYVDNWELVTSDPEAALQQLEVVMTFSRMLDLTVDRSKTFCWSTSPEIRGRFRSMGIPVRHSVKDLGAHLAFSRQRTNRTIADRVATLEPLWDSLRRNASPYHLKVLAIKSICWPRGLHAVSSTPLCDTMLSGLRSKACQALMGRRAGVNPMVLLGLLEADVDDQWHALVQTVRDVRSFAPLGFLQESVAPFAHGLLTLPPNSPASILTTRLHQVCCSVSSGGLIKDPLGHFDLATCNSTELRLRLEFGWTLAVSSSLSHRSDFTGLSQVDVATTRKVVSRFSPPQKTLLRLGLTGAMFTGDCTYHWSQGGQTQCKWCGEQDSLTHRYWQCTQTLKARTELAPHAVQVWQTLPPVLTLRGWALKPDSWCEWMRYLTNIDTSLPVPRVSLTDMRSETGWVDVFTDGSCTAQTEPLLYVLQHGAWWWQHLFRVDGNLRREGYWPLKPCRVWFRQLLGPSFSPWHMLCIKQLFNRFQFGSGPTAWELFQDFTFWLVEYDGSKWILLMLTFGDGWWHRFNLWGPVEFKFWKLQHTKNCIWPHLDGRCGGYGTMTQQTLQLRPQTWVDLRVFGFCGTNYVQNGKKGTCFIKRSFDYILQWRKWAVQLTLQRQLTNWTMNLSVVQLGSLRCTMTLPVQSMQSLQKCFKRFLGRCRERFRSGGGKEPLECWFPRFDGSHSTFFTLTISWLLDVRGQSALGNNGQNGRCGLTWYRRSIVTLHEYAGSDSSSKCFGRPLASWFGRQRADVTLRFCHLSLPVLRCRGIVVTSDALKNGLVHVSRLIVRDKHVSLKFCRYLGLALVWLYQIGFLTRVANFGDPKRLAPRLEQARRMESGKCCLQLSGAFRMYEGCLEPWTDVFKTNIWLIIKRNVASSRKQWLERMWLDWTPNTWNIPCLPDSKHMSAACCSVARLWNVRQLSRLQSSKHFVAFKSLFPEVVEQHSIKECTLKFMATKCL